MTTSSILPSIGPPPPGFKRPYVPESLRPSASVPATVKVVSPSPPSEFLASKGPGEGGQTGQQARSNSAVEVQVREAATAVESLPARLSDISDEEQSEISRLSERDREVRAHETAHATAGGGYAGRPSFDYVQGPDGVQYAVGGHVDIDVSEVPDNPQATINKMEVVQRAALAPARPSGQDKAVAAAAAAKIREAEAQVSKEARETRGTEKAASAASVQPAGEQGQPALVSEGTEISGLNLLV